MKSHLRGRLGATGRHFALPEGSGRGVPPKIHRKSTKNRQKKHEKIASKIMLGTCVPALRLQIFRQSSGLRALKTARIFGAGPAKKKEPAKSAGPAPQRRCRTLVPQVSQNHVQNLCALTSATDFLAEFKPVRVQNRAQSRVPALQKITGSSTRPALNRNTARWNRSSLGTVAGRRCAPLDIVTFCFVA